MPAGLCFFHSDPAPAAELGPKGQMANRHVYESGGADVFAPKNAVAPRPVFTNASISHGRTTPNPCC